MHCLTEPSEASTSASTGCASIRLSPKLLRITSGELRRRRYIDPNVVKPHQGNQAVLIPCAPIAGIVEDARASLFCCSDSADVIAEGPLQHQTFFRFWSWRWYVLDRTEMRVYADEESRCLEPEMPLERHSSKGLRAARDLYYPSSLILIDTSLGNTVAYLRSGQGLQWEAVAAISLWLHAFEESARQHADGNGLPDILEATSHVSGAC